MTYFALIASAISLTIVFYVTWSMIVPLNLPLYLKAPFVLLLLAAAFKEFIFRILGGGMFFVPDLPRWIMVTGALLYNFLIVALFLLVIKDAFWIIWKIGSALTLIKRTFPGGAAARCVLVIAAVLALYGTWEAVRVPDIVTHDIYLPGLASEFEGTKIVLLADLHASSLNRRPFIQAIVDKTNALSSDVILIPGDFVDGPVQDRRDDLEPLSGLNASLGVWGTSGNHEYYSGYGEWRKQLAEFGVTILENEHIVLTSGEGKLVIAGVPDPQGANPGFGFTEPFEAPNIEKALENAPVAPVILMAHRPEDAPENARAGVALQLSGHTHGGQMPIISQMIARFNNGYVRGWYDVGTMKLYVSRGTSQWGGFAMRLFDPAEITLLVLHGTDSNME